MGPITIVEYSHTNINLHNRYRLLCEKFGSTVYKIPDDLWERNYQQFQVSTFCYTCWK